MDGKMVEKSYNEWIDLEGTETERTYQEFRRGPTPTQVWGECGAGR